MKKILAFALILMGASSVCAHVNYVSKIAIEPYNLQMDTLRAHHVDLAQYMVELEYAAEQVKTVGNQIKETQLQAKEERALLKSLTDGLKSAQKSMDASEKITRQQIKEFDNVLKMMDKQLNQVHKTLRVDKNARHAIENGLDHEASILREEQKSLNERLRAISDARKLWDGMNKQIAEGLAELDKKDATLKEWADQNKQQADILKTEVKTTKEQIKASK